MCTFSPVPPRIDDATALPVSSPDEPGGSNRGLRREDLDGQAITRSRFLVESSVCETRRTSYGQLPPCGIDCFDVPVQVRSQLEPPEHATEHEPLHVTWHVEPPVHEMLPLAPSVTVQVDSPLQSMLHDWLQLPEQSFLLVHASEQLPPAPQLFAVKSQLAPVGQLQLAPVHVTGIELLEPPQPATQRIAIKPSSFISPSLDGRAWSASRRDDR